MVEIRAFPLDQNSYLTEVFQIEMTEKGSIYKLYRDLKVLKSSNIVEGRYKNKCRVHIK